jgi:hypothetical protein
MDIGKSTIEIHAKSIATKESTLSISNFIAKVIYSHLHTPMNFNLLA